MTIVPDADDITTTPIDLLPDQRRPSRYSRQSNFGHGRAEQHA